MKSLTGLFLVLFTFSALANVPDAIVCTSNAQMPELKLFKLTEINSDSPDMNIYDVPFNENYSDSESMSLYFSNECENSYVLEIPMSDLEKLESGLVDSVIGSLDYSQYAGTEEVEVYEEIISITCSKL